MIAIKTLNFGCDPEFFFSKKVRFGSILRRTVIGSEKVLGKAGALSNGRDSVIIDGVQAEINVHPVTCREYFNGNMSRVFALIAKQLRNRKGVEVDWRVCVKVTKKELMSLSDSARGFGCKPSFNIYGEQPELPDPSTYLYRAAGGHIHLSGAYDDSKTLIRKNLPTIIKLMDYLVANTCVLIDRDPGNKERRKVYGRAGEYRTPAYGLEYRVLSNFWLRSSQLTSLVLGLSRIAVSFAAYPGLVKEIFAAVPEADIIRAINENDAALARKNFDKLKPILVREVPATATIGAHRMAAFEYLVATGINRWFKGDLVKGWTGMYSGVQAGWETFCVNELDVVRKRVAA